MSERWKPKHGETYYWIDIVSNVGGYTWRDDSLDRLCYESGNCFKTKEKAKSAAEKVKALLLSLHEPTKDCNRTPKLTAEAIERPSKLPDWCKVREWCFCLDDDGNCKYFKITKIKNNFIYGEDWDIDYHFVKQARLRPYNAEEMRGLVGTLIRKGPSLHIVTGYENVIDDECMIHVNGCLYNANDLLRQFAIDNEPCGVLEHLSENGEWVE